MTERQGDYVTNRQDIPTSPDTSAHDLEVRDLISQMVLSARDHQHLFDLLIDEVFKWSRASVRDRQRVEELEAELARLREMSS